MKIKINVRTLLPAHYTPAKEPVYQGKGNHSVMQLEEICEQYKKLVHQLRIREQNIIVQCNAELISEQPLPKQDKSVEEIMTECDVYPVNDNQAQNIALAIREYAQQEVLKFTNQYVKRPTWMTANIESEALKAIQDGTLLYAVKVIYEESKKNNDTRIWGLKECKTYVEQIMARQPKQFSE